MLVFAVLPAEFAVDLTGVGRLLGLTSMGEIKRRLADQADAEAKAGALVGSSSASGHAPSPATLMERAAAADSLRAASRVQRSIPSPGPR